MSNSKPLGFITLSTICHGLCVAALGMAPVSHLGPQTTEAVEMALEETPQGQQMTEPEALPQPEPVKVEEKKVEVKPVVKKAAPKVAAALPKKAVKSVDLSEKTEIPAEQAVTVAPPEELKPDVSEEDLQPVKEMTPAGVVAAEATAEEPVKEEPKMEDTKPEEPAPVEGTVAESIETTATEGTAAAPVAAYGTPDGGARSYLELKQKPGNRAPEYPMQARRDSRQGQVDLMYYVTREGKVDQIKVAKSSGFTDLDQEALKTVAQYRYVPGQEGWTSHPVNFSLKGQTVPAPGRLRTLGQSK